MFKHCTFAMERGYNDNKIFLKLMKLHYRGKDHDAYLSHIKVQLTASKREVNLVLVYGITESPMMNEEKS